MNERFKKQFGLPSNGFLEPIDLKDVPFGFSVYKEREPGFRSLFRVFINKKDSLKEGNLKPITVTANYGKESPDGDGIITASSDFKRGLFWPIGLRLDNEYFYNIASDLLYDQDDRVVDGIEILKKVEELHTKPARLIRGLSFRIKLLFFQVFLASVFKFLFYLFSGIQYLFSGKKITIYHNLFESETHAQSTVEDRLRTSSSPPIDIFGYKVKPQVAALYCIFHLFVYGIFYRYNYRPVWILDIFKNSFLTLMYGIVSLGAANVIFSRFSKGNQLFITTLVTLQGLYLKCLSKNVGI